jgi:predicted transcriptional regulator
MPPSKSCVNIVLPTALAVRLRRLAELTHQSQSSLVVELLVEAQIEQRIATVEKAQAEAPGRILRETEAVFAAMRTSYQAERTASPPVEAEGVASIEMADPNPYPRDLEAERVRIKGELQQAIDKQDPEAAWFLRAELSAMAELKALGQNKVDFREFASLVHSEILRTDDELTLIQALHPGISSNESPN